MLSRAAYEVPESLLQRAAACPRAPTAVVGANDELAMESARMAEQQGLIEPVLVGDPATIASLAGSLGWDIAHLSIVAAADETTAAQNAVELASSGAVTALMKGQVHTDVLIRAVLSKAARLRTARRLSHVFHMTLPGRKGSLCITDAVVNVRPDVDTRMHIAANAIELLHALEVATPKVAVLSATEQVNASMPSSVEADEIRTRASTGEVGQADVYGPLAMDNVLSTDAAALKGIDSPVAGNADILLVPNIETGNALYKAMVYLLSATAAGVVLGARVPIILTSRADPTQARLASAALAVIAASRNADNESRQC